MNDVTLLAAVITGSFMLLVAIATGLWARANKRIPEPTPIEKVWARLDEQDIKVEALKTEVGTLQDQVVAYRGGFLAHVSWAARVKDQWTGSVPIVTFTAEEEQAIAKGLDMAALTRVHRDQ